MSLSQYEIQQRVRESERPLWQRLQWIEDTSRLVVRLQQSKPVDPPEWVLENLRKKARLHPTP